MSELSTPSHMCTIFFCTFYFSRQVFLIALINRKSKYFIIHKWHDKNDVKWQDSHLFFFLFDDYLLKWHECDKSTLSIVKVSLCVMEGSGLKAVHDSKERLVCSKLISLQLILLTLFNTRIYSAVQRHSLPTTWNLHSLHLLNDFKCQIYAN